MFSQFLDIKPDDEGWTGATIALNVPGGIRAGMLAGDILYGDLSTTTPFGNNLHSVELQGKVIWEALEFGVSNPEFGKLLQVSGLKAVFDLSKPFNHTLISVDVLCRLCAIPRYETLDSETFYRVAMPDFLARGGDGFSMIANGARNLIVGPVDLVALENYVAKFSPFNVPQALGRITFI